MTTSSVTCSSEALRIVDGVVVGPTWAEHLGRELLASLRAVDVAAPDSPDGDECFSDVDVAARVFFDVLRSHPAAARWPLFSASAARHSLFKAAVTHSLNSDEVSALVRLSDESALVAANVARWLLRLPQQTSPTLVFTPPPRLLPRPRARAAPVPDEDVHALVS